MKYINQKYMSIIQKLPIAILALVAAVVTVALWHKWHILTINDLQMVVKESSCMKDWVETHFINSTGVPLRGMDVGLQRQVCELQSSAKTQSTYNK